MPGLVLNWSIVMHGVLVVSTHRCSSPTVDLRQSLRESPEWMLLRSVLQREKAVCP